VGSLFFHDHEINFASLAGLCMMLDLMLRMQSHAAFHQNNVCSSFVILITFLCQNYVQLIPNYANIMVLWRVVLKRQIYCHCDSI
jgi:hypothetical protein